MSAVRTDPSAPVGAAAAAARTAEEAEAEVAVAEAVEEVVVFSFLGTGVAATRAKRPNVTREVENFMLIFDSFVELCLEKVCKKNKQER